MCLGRLCLFCIEHLIKKGLLATKPLLRARPEVSCENPWARSSQLDWLLPSGFTFPALLLLPSSPQNPRLQFSCIVLPWGFSMLFPQPIPGCDGGAAGFSAAVIKRRCGASAREGEPKPLAHLRFERGRRACINGIIMCLFPEKKKECILCLLMTFKLTVL